MVLLILLLSFFFSTSAKPNIVLLIADDLGYGEVGTFPCDSPHGRMLTPNIDLLAKQGLQFTEAYAGETVCAPSRASLLTGLHTGHCPIRGNLDYKGSDFPLPSNYSTIASILKTGGYSTAAIGKWGLGADWTEGAPWKHGFDYYYGQLGQNDCHDFYPTFIWENDNKIDLPQNSGATQERCMSQPDTCSFTQDLFTNKALEWLSNQTTSQPFFLYMAWTIPHAGGYQGALETGAPVPSWAPYTDKSWPDVEKGHAAGITSYLDRDVERIVQQLEKLNMDKNTVVFFVSDNGAHNEGNHNYLFFNSSGPLRGYKRSLYEGGIRSPIIVKWPGVVKAGTSSSFSWGFWDLLPTLADIAGITPQNLPPNDGVSILPTLTGNQQTPKQYLYWEFCTNSAWGHAVRKENWKGVSFSLFSDFELYDLSNDIHEDHNVASLHPSIVSQLNQIAKQAHTEDPNFPQVQPCQGS